MTSRNESMSRISSSSPLSRSGFPGGQNPPNEGAPKQSGRDCSMKFLLLPSGSAEMIAIETHQAADARRDKNPHPDRWMRDSQEEADHPQRDKIIRPGKGHAGPEEKPQQFPP